MNTDALTDFVDQLNAPASTFPTMADFNASSTSEALQKADGSCCSAWACGMLTNELLQNPMVMVSSRLFVRPTGSKTSKIGRVYNSYLLLPC